jgi:hypothetical protein
MQVLDYNGAGRWSDDSIRERYRSHSQQLGTLPSDDIKAKNYTQDGVTRIYPIMDEVIAGIELGDKACVLIGIEFIEEDQVFSFGRILKSTTARALRRAELSPDQIERLRKRIVGMLLAGSVPREFREYSKLLRRIGVGSWWPTIERQIDRKNPYVMRYYNCFRDHCRRESQVPET